MYRQSERAKLPRAAAKRSVTAPAVAEAAAAVLAVLVAEVCLVVAAGPF